MAEASIGRRWIAYKGIRVPKILRVVEVFLHATGTRVPPEIIHQCWPIWHTETPMQNLDGIRRDIVHKLDEVAMRCTSPIAWDPFAFPLTDDTCWRKEALCYRPEKHLTSERVCPVSNSCFRTIKENTHIRATLLFLKVHVSL